MLDGAWQISHTAFDQASLQALYTSVTILVELSSHQARWEELQNRHAKSIKSFNTYVQRRILISSQNELAKGIHGFDMFTNSMTHTMFLTNTHTHS